MLNKVNITPEQFLSTLFDPSDRVCLRVFSDRKDSAGMAFKGLKLEAEAAKFPTIADTLRKHNEQHRGIFFTVNFGGHTDSEITRINAQFVESDEGTHEEQWERIQTLPLPPSLVVKTQKSLHCYWLVKNAEVGKFRKVQKQLVTQFNGDPACVNESRVLRLPSFDHCKFDPVPVECVLFAPERRYTQDELSAVLPQVADEPTSAIGVSPAGQAPKGSRKGLTQVGKRCSFIQHCKANAATLPENQWYAMISNLVVFEDGDKAVHALSKPYPKYSYAETQGKIVQFLNSGTKPMTCAKIAECGFKCTRLAEGGCECKSPAALAFKPLSTEELLIVLNNFDIPTAPLDKIKIIKSFVQDYLYNIEPVIAEAIINYEVKSHFGLKATDIAPMVKLHREIHKKYTASKEVRREVSADEGLADWYEVTDRGGLRFLPDILADHMTNNVPVFYGAGAYYFYNNGVYTLGDEDMAKNAVRGFMIPKHRKTSDISDTTVQWRIQIRKEVREINANPFIINLKNGLYNVLDNSFKEHSAEYYSTVQLNAAYDPSAKCPQFLAFLGDILPATELDLIQELIGYLLIPVNKAQKAFVLVGAPNAGKSTLLSIVQEVLLGAENVANIPWQSLGDRFYKAELFGKLANVFADLPSKAIDDGGWFKALTGEDFITAERKNKDPFSYRPYARLLFSCNDIPKNYADRSDGFYRRLLIIRFDKSVPKERRDPNLREKIAAERDGILAWALQGLRRLIANSYTFSETERTAAEIQRYKVESNSALLFLEECCDVDGKSEVVRETLFEKYKDYCAKNGFKALSQTNFNRDVENSDPRITRARDKVGSRHIWRGIGLV